MSRLPRWHSWQFLGLLFLLMCAPFLLVDLPPFTDVPGHTAAAAIEAAPPGSILHRYFSWTWIFSLNLGGEALMKVLLEIVPLTTAGWLTTVIATALYVLGALATFRSLNPRGAHGLGFALIFVFSFPLLWGFINFTIASGIALLAFAVTEEVKNRRARVAILLLAQPVALVSHAIGGLLLPLLIASASLGKEIDREDSWSWARAARRIWAHCWPLLMSVFVIAAWKGGSPPTPGTGMVWAWSAKLGFLNDVLRDQNLILDLFSCALVIQIAVFGSLFGARWQWRTGLPALAVLAAFVLLPAEIEGSEAVDIRMLPTALLLILGLQDWSGASRQVRKVILIGGLGLLMTRLAFLMHGFVEYDQSYKRELSALSSVREGSRIFSLTERPCSKTIWRLARLDTLPAMASPLRSAWVNRHWSVAGLHMIQSRWHPEVVDVAHASECGKAGHPVLEDVLAGTDFAGFDYIWLMGTGAPASPPPNFKAVWHAERSWLFERQPNLTSGSRRP